MSVPEEISRREERLKAIRKAKAEIEYRSAARYAEENKVYEAKLANRKRKQEKTRKKPPGKPPKPPTAGPSSKDQVNNLTDDESRIMPISGGGFDQCYNAQAGVDTAIQLIVCSHVSQKPNDKQEMKPAIEELQGYTVTVCMSGPEALCNFQSSPVEFALVITDMTMPLMTGTELSQNVANHQKRHLCYLESAKKINFMPKH